MPGTSIDYRFNYSLSQIFSPSLLKNINNPAHEQTLRALLNDCQIYPNNRSWNLSCALETTYSYLKDNYRCEYVYMNEIANQLLLQFHNDNSATLLKEVNSDASIADIVIINGDTVAYEIKTELDSLDRLVGQMESYKSLYDFLYVVTSEEYVESVLGKTIDNVGIIILDKKGILQTIKKASSNREQFAASKAALTIRQSELMAAYEKRIGKLPMMGTALIHDFCLQWYFNLDTSTAHQIFSESLKSRKPSSYQFDLIMNCSYSLKALLLGKTLTKKYCSAFKNRFITFG